MIFIDKEEIKKQIDLNEMMDQIEYAYKLYGKGEFFMPERPVIEHNNKTMIYMPCYTKEVIGTKILSLFPDNAKLGLPSLDGVILLNDGVTGKPLALLDGQSVTAYRTGAIGGVAIRHLAKKEAKSVGIVGAGTQSFYQALYACAARDIKKVGIYNHSDRNLSSYIKELKAALNNDEIEVVQYQDVKELVKNSDIICTATLAKTPVLPDDEELLRGKCIVAIGSYTPEAREIPDAVFNLVKNVYIELPYAMEETGDLRIPIKSGKLSKDRVVLMSDYLKEPTKEIKEGETTYFKSVGMALFDICASNYLLNKTKEN